MFQLMDAIWFQATGLKFFDFQAVDVGNCKYCDAYVAARAKCRIRMSTPYQQTIAWRG